MKAAILPVRGTSPMKVPKYAATEWNAEICSRSMNDPMEVAIAARPTRAWNAATVYGSYVISTYLPIK